MKIKETEKSMLQIYERRSQCERLQGDGKDLCTLWGERQASSHTLPQEI